MPLVGTAKLHKVRSIFSHDGPYPMTVDLVHSRGARLCYRSPNQIGCLEFCCLGGQAKRAGPRRETIRFLAWRTRVLGKEFATDRERLVSRQKMAVFLPR